MPHTFIIDISFPAQDQLDIDEEKERLAQGNNDPFGEG